MLTKSELTQGRVNMNWFNWSSPWIGNVRLWNLFNRQCKGEEHYWGIGIMQIGNRHLLYIGDRGFLVLFIGKTD